MLVTGTVLQKIFGGIVAPLKSRLQVASAEGGRTEVEAAKQSSEVGPVALESQLTFCGSANQRSVVCILLFITRSFVAISLCYKSQQLRNLAANKAKPTRQFNFGRRRIGKYA